MDYKEKFTNISKNIDFLSLPTPDRDFIEHLANSYKFTFQELKKIVSISKDLRMWDEGDIKKICSFDLSSLDKRKLFINKKL
jgi:hypothetical protein